MTCTPKAGEPAKKNAAEKGKGKRSSVCEINLVFSAGFEARGKGHPVKEHDRNLEKL